MAKVLLYSLLLVAGLAISQFMVDLPGWVNHALTLATMIALSFIMIHVGHEFEIDKSKPLQYTWDYLVAFTAAAFPWFFCSLYFVYIMAPSQLWTHGDLWRESLLQARFASPTSAGVLFSMLAAAGLAATWLFKKARILAIFDDLDTILLMIPLKIMIVGFKWQLAIIVMVIVSLLWAAWRYLHVLRWPVTWPFVLSYSVVIAVVCDLIYVGSKVVDDSVPVHLEVLLPAFVLGCMLGRSPEHETSHDHVGRQEILAATVISAIFMVLVGLSMPPITGGEPASAPAGEQVLAYAGVPESVLAEKNAFPGWGWIAIHVVAVTAVSNIGKMFPAFCYRREAGFRERLALAIGMWPRGEVGAGILVISLSYGLGGPILTVAALSLALNLLCTGLFILVVKLLLRTGGPMGTAPEPLPA